jgi:hypothetical protein
MLLAVVRVLDPENVARDLDDRVLEPPSGAHQRNSALTRVANGRERPFWMDVGVTWRQEDGVEAAQAPCHRVDLACGNPFGAHAIEMVQGIGREAMALPLGIEIANDGDAERHGAH